MVRDRFAPAPSDNAWLGPSFATTRLTASLLDTTALISAMRGLPFALLFGCLVAGGPTLAGPEGGNVVAGAADIVQSTPRRLDINQSSDKAVIDWRSFSIGTDEHTNFNQPSASSITLNRVTGDARSDILGRLTANGQVMLINPHGILFGRTARIDVAGLVATTIDIANDDFMAGRFNFDQGGEPGAVVINRGEITVAEGGLAAFVAPGVENSGVIQARLGRVALASGNSFTLDLYGDSLVHLAVGDEVATQLLDPEGEKLTSLVGNSGTIRADGGTVLLAAAAAKSVVDHVINMDGIVEARSVHAENGEIVLMGGDDGIVRVAGRLDASGRDDGETGGTVKVLGEKVGLYDGARIDASGDAGGGTVLIGGNYQGEGPERAAARTYVDDNVRIAADALDSGNGGRVIVWAEEFTNYRGAISARGGAAGGDGGFAEVSGKDSLAFHGTADLRSPHGARGTLLLDPKNITITNGGSDTVSANDTFAENAAADASFDADDIVAALNGANLTLQANNDITVSEAIDASGGGTGNLVVQAGRSITVNQNVTLNGSFTATANDTAAQAGNRDAGAAAFTVADGVTINTATANANIVITMSTGAGGTTSGDITLEGLNAGSGHIDISNDGATNGSDVLRASADSSIVAASVAFDISDGTNNSSGGIGTSAAPMLTTVTNLAARGQGGGVFVTESNALTVGGATLGGLTGVTTAGGNGDIALTLTAGNLDFASEAITADGSGDVTLTLSEAGAAVITDNAVDDIASTSGDITITADTLTLASGNITSSGALVLQPDETGRSVGVSGGNGNFNLSATELDLLSDGFSSITIGRSDGTGLLSISAGTFRDPMVFRVGGSAGRIGVGGAITSAAANASLTFTAGNILSSIGAISSGAGDITITADSVGISESITGTGALVIQPATATRTVGIGGGSGSFNLNDAEINRLSDGFSSITIGRSDGTGAVDVDAVTFNDNLTIRGGAMTVTGLAAGANNVTLTSASTIDEDADDTVADITTSGTLSLTAGGAIGASGGNGALDLTVGTLQATTSAGGIFLRESDTLIIGGTGVQTTGGDADIEVALAAGDLTLNEDITANGSGDVTLTLSGSGAAVTADNADDDIASTSGDITITADTLTLASGNITSSGALVLQPNSTTRSVGVSGGAGDFNLSSTEIDLLSDGFSSITIGRADSTALMTIGADTYRDPMVFRMGGAGGDITIGGAITSATANAALTFTAGTGTGGTFTQGANTIASGSGDITITADVVALSTVANSITGTGAITLQPATSTTTIGIGDGATGTFDLDSAEIGALSDGFSSITIGRSDGTGAVDIDAVTFNDPVTIRGGAMTVTGLAVSGSENITLTSSSTIDEDADDTTTDITSSGGRLTMTAQGAIGASDGNGALDLAVNTLVASTNAGGIFVRENSTLTVSGTGVQTTAGNAPIEITVASGSFTVLDDITAHGSGNVTLTLSEENVTLNAATANSDIVSTSGDITITADNVILSGSVTSSGALVLEPATTTRTVGIGGGSGDFNLTDIEIGNLSDGFSSITIGRSDGTGAVDSDAVTFNDPLTIRGGAIAVTGLAAGTNTVTLTSSGAITDGDGGTTTDITGSTVTLTAVSGIGATGANDSLEVDATTLSATNSTSGGIVITESDDVTVNQLDQDGSGNVSLTSGGGAITIAAGQSGVTATSGTVTLDADTALTVNDVVTTTGGAVDLDAGTTLTLNAALTGAGGAVALDGGSGVTVTASGDVTTTTGAVTFGGNAAGAITTAGDVTTAGGTVTYARGTTLSGAVTVNTGTGGGDILFDGTVDGTTADSESLTLTAGTGDITFAGNVGVTTRLDGVTINSAKDVTMQATMETTTFTQAAGSGTTDTGSGTLNTTGAITITAADITGAINGGDLTLTSESGIEVTVDVASLTIDGPRATIIGTVAGEGGAGAAAVIVITERGPGPYTANGFTILGLDQTGSGTANRQDVELAAMPTSVMLRPSAQPPTPGEAVYMQFVPVQQGTNYGPIESPYATNVFQLPFALVTPAAGTEVAYEGQPGIGDSLWQQLGVGAPPPVPAGSASHDQPGLTTALAPPAPGLDEAVAVP